MLYEMNDKTLTGIDRTSFHEESVAEADLQEALREHPEFIEDGLFVISDEFSDWSDSGRSIDLLCVDSDGNLVVVELKRADGAHMELQAIRYAAMMANFPTQRIIEGHGRYLRNKGESGDPLAEQRIREHLELAPDEEISIATEHPRIVLISEDFNKEITTSVLWLNEMGLDIRCVRVRTYRHEEKLLLDIDQVIPLPEAEEYMVTARNREQEARASTGNASRRAVPGISKFEEAIDNLPPEQREQSDSILAFVRELQEAGLAEPVSYSYLRGGGVVRLLLPVGRAHLAYFSCETSDRRLYIGVRKSNFNRYAPDAMGRVWSALGKEAETAQSVWSAAPFSEELFNALREAYRMANGD